MRKLVFVFGTIVALSFIACTGDGQQDNNKIVLADSAADADTTLLVTGVAVDGAMNSVYLKVGDDTVEFSYPDLDSDHRASWEINDTLTVHYIKTENGDSVTEVINHADA
ncbi:MAG: hypothetical protein IKZ92_08010 [Muribaculaceae bacterium]|nr:hypothetical protein [Muribaculaceae bacterium]